MKSKPTLRSYLALAGSSLLAISSASASIYYWDNNGSTAGFGTATGTWDSAGTLGSGTQGWGTDVTGLIAPTGTITTLNTNSTTDALNFGTATAGLAAGPITVSGIVSAGDITFGSASGAVVLSGGTITLTAAQTTTVNNTTDTIGSILAGASTSFTKAGTGTLILTGANSYTGTTIIRGGTLNLGNSTATGSLASTALELQGVTLSYTRTDSATQNFSTTAIRTGVTAVTAVAGNTLGLGDITRVTGGTLAVGTTGTITTSDGNDASGILGSWAFHGTQYAKETGGTIGAYTGATQDTESNWTDAAANYEITIAGTKTLTVNRVGNTFRYSGAGAGGIALGSSGSNTLTTNGILAVGGALTISRAGGTGSVIAGSTGEIVMAGSQAVTISAPISSGAVTYSGTGALTLSGANTYAGGFTLNSGRVGLSAGTYSGFGSGTLTVTGGSGSITANDSSAVTINNDLNWGGSILFARAGGSSGTPTLTWNGALTLSSNLALKLGVNTTAGSAVFTNNISGAFGINVVSDGPTALTNTLTLSGANNTFSGGLSLTPIKGMFLNINSATALGATAGTFTIGSGGVVTIDNTSAAAITLTNNNPLAINANFVFTGTRDLNMGTGAVNLGGGTRTITTTAGIFTLGGVISSGGITKAGAGILELPGANGYTGTTAVSTGSLVAGADAPSGSAGAFGNAFSEISLGVASGNGAASILTGGAFTIGRVIRNNSTDGTDSGTRVLTLGGNSAHDSEFSGNIFLGVASRTSKGIQLSAVAGGQVTFSGVIQNPSGQTGGEITSAAALTAVTKVGLGTVVLGNTNLYTGATAVKEGTLALGTLASINASANISIAAGTTFDVSQQASPYTLSASTTLSASGTGTTAGSTAARIVGPSADVVSLGAQTVTLTWAGDTSGTDTDSPPLHVSQGALALDNNAITINGSTLGLGAYRLIQVGDGATGTLNENVTPSYAVSGTAIDGTKTNVISSDGSGNIILTVTAGGGVTFADWKTANGAGLQTLADDHDDDGVDNGTEFFLGGNTITTGFTALPPVVNTGGTLSVTWAKHPNYPGAYHTDFVVETSDTLIGAWTTELTPPSTVTISGNNVTYTFPNPLGTKKFARLKVTGP